MAGCENCNVTDFCHMNHGKNGTCTGGGCYGGGDVRLGECFWRFAGNRQGIGPTVPYSRAGVKVFGAQFGEIVGQAEAVIRGEHCNEHCRFVLNRVISTDMHHATKDDYLHAMRTFSTTYGHAKRLLNGNHKVRKPGLVVASPLTHR